MHRGSQLRRPVVAVRVVAVLAVVVRAERLDEAAYDTAGDPLVEGEDPLDINTEVAQEMLA